MHKAISVKSVLSLLSACVLFWTMSVTVLATEADGFQVNEIESSETVTSSGEPDPAPTTTEEGDEEGEPDEDPEDEKGEIGGEEGDDEGDDKSDLLDEVDLLDELDESERAGAVMRAPVSAQVSAQASAPMAVAGPRYTGIEGFVERLYSSVLGREAYDEEVRGYAAELRSGQLTAAQILLSFFGSAEFANRGLTNEEYVAVMYKVVLDREAWPEEIRGYSKELAAGYPRRALIQNFCYSLEFGKLAAGYGLEVGRLEYSYEMDRNPQMAMFVYRTYTLVLGRTKVWDEEIEGRVREMVNGDITAGQLALTCYMSPEFNNRRLSNEDFVASLYRTLLDREPWPEEISGWSKQLEQGASNNYMFQQFVYSREFANVCDRYGLTVGSFTIPDVVGPNTSTGGGNSNNGDTLTVQYAGQTYTDSRIELIAKIVYAEMGGFRNSEAYKAQAVAIYTYILYKQNTGGIAVLPVKDVPASVSDMIYSAVREVDGMYLVDGNGNVAQTTYYASAGNRGYTNSAQDFWGSNVGYLASVASPYDNMAANTYHTNTTKISIDSVRQMLLRTYGTKDNPANIYADPSDWFTLTYNQQTGYVTSVKVLATDLDKDGNITYRTPKVEYFYQTMLGIRSPSFTIKVEGDQFVITTYGHGHGVGMSQYGALGYAQAGQNYQWILDHYYPGTTLKTK